MDKDFYSHSSYRVISAISNTTTAATAAVTSASTRSFSTLVTSKDSSSNVPATATTSSDSAYNSEHELTPEHREEQQSANKQPSLQKQTTGIKVKLIEEELWKSFNKIGNEMIVTKPGRRLFPALAVSLKGLHPALDYRLTLRIAPADPYRYKFINMKWSKVGESEINQNEDKQLYLHPSSPNSGAFWTKKPISFRSLKITHNPCSKNGHILLHTMHKYVIEIIFSPTGGSGDDVISLPETTFMAVSAYQNTNLTQLKIDHNPFAKGFRDRIKAASLQQSQMGTFNPTGLAAFQYYAGDGYRAPILSHPMQVQPLLSTQQIQGLSLPPLSTRPLYHTHHPTYPLYAHHPQHHMAGQSLVNGGSDSSSSPMAATAPATTENGPPMMVPQMLPTGTLPSQLTPFYQAPPSYPLYAPTIMGGLPESTSAPTSQQ